MKNSWRYIAAAIAVAVIALSIMTPALLAAVTKISVGGTTALPAGSGVEFTVLRATVNMADYPLATGDALRIINIPEGSLVIGISAEVIVADSVSTATADVALYADDDDAALYPVEGETPAVVMIDELALGALGRVVQEPPDIDDGRLRGISSALEAAYIGIVPGAAGVEEGGEGEAEADNAVIVFKVAIVNLNL